MINENTKDTPYILIPGIAAGVFAAITIIISLGGIAATIFVPEGMAAFFLAIVASLLSLVAGLVVILAAAVIAIFTKSGHIRVYSIAFCSLFLVVTFFVNVSAYGWFFFDPVKRAEYEEERAVYDKGAGRLFANQLDNQKETSIATAGFFAWRVDMYLGDANGYIEGTKNGVPMFVRASTYAVEGEHWSIWITGKSPVPFTSSTFANQYLEEWRVNEGQPEYYETYTDTWVSITEIEPYFNTTEKIDVLNALIEDEDVIFTSYGDPRIEYYLTNEEDVGDAAEHHRLAEYIDTLSKLYPAERK
jgi:hypothetical protein